MPRYDLRCEKGHLFETVMQWDSFQARGHICPSCGEQARVVILEPPEVQVDTVTLHDHTQMAGPIAKTWRTRKDRDAWLKKENRWIPEANDPNMKSAFQLLEHERQERRTIEARGERWQDVERDRRERAERDKTVDLKSKGITLEKLSFQDVQRKLKESKDLASQSGYTSDEMTKWFGGPESTLARADGNVARPENDWPDIPVSEALKEMAG